MAASGEISMTVDSLPCSGLLSCDKGFEEEEAAMRTVKAAFAVVVILGAVAGGQAAASASGGAEATSVGFNVNANDRNGWTMSTQGEVQFFNGFRHFRIYGNPVINRGGFRYNSGYVAVKQNIANTTNDGRWYTMGTSASGMDRYLDTDTWVEHTWYGFIGQDDGGEYWSWPTTSGRGLKGVWVRVCHQIDGPDVCGRKAYLDNPYIAGTTP